MDGTGTLFTPFTTALAASAFLPHVIAYPADRALDYDALLATIPLPDEPCVVLAESFSGPLGVRLAAAHPDRVRALILVATFVTNPSPLAKLLHAVLRAQLFAFTPPAFALRAMLLGNDAPDDAVAALQHAMRIVPRDVMSARLSAITHVDERTTFAALTQPVLYLAGDHDRLVGQPLRDELCALRPATTVQTLAAPHLVLQRRPHEAAAVITAWLEQNVTGT